MEQKRIRYKCLYLLFLFCISFEAALKEKLSMKTSSFTTEEATLQKMFRYFDLNNNGKSLRFHMHKVALTPRSGRKLWKRLVLYIFQIKILSDFSNLTILMGLVIQITRNSGLSSSVVLFLHLLPNHQAKPHHSLFLNQQSKFNLFLM